MERKSYLLCRCRTSSFFGGDRGEYVTLPYISNAMHTRCRLRLAPRRCRLPLSRTGIISVPAPNSRAAGSASDFPAAVRFSAVLAAAAIIDPAPPSVGLLRSITKPCARVYEMRYRPCKRDFHAAARFILPCPYCYRCYRPCATVCWLTRSTDIKALHLCNNPIMRLPRQPPYISHPRLYAPCLLCRACRCLLYPEALCLKRHIGLLR